VRVCANVLCAQVEFARGFNGDTELRFRLRQAGFMRDKAKGAPELYYQEAHGLTIYLQALFRLYKRQVLCSDREGRGRACASEKIVRGDSCLFRRGCVTYVHPPFLTRPKVASQRKKEARPRNACDP
jgi:hypothetical protein